MAWLSWAPSPRCSNLRACDSRECKRVRKKRTLLRCAWRFRDQDWVWGLPGGGWKRKRACGEVCVYLANAGILNRRKLCLIETIRPWPNQIVPDRNQSCLHRPWSKSSVPGRTKSCLIGTSRACSKQIAPVRSKSCLIEANRA